MLHTHTHVTMCVMIVKHLSGYIIFDQLLILRSKGGDVTQTKVLV